MRLSDEKRALLDNLQRQIVQVQTGKAVLSSNPLALEGLGLLATAFPGGIFPCGAVHEFLSHDSGCAAATEGFMAALAGHLMGNDGVCFWVSSYRTVFPPALSAFGLYPERIIFIDPAREKDVLWIVEQGLKSTALSVVVGETRNLSFTESQRLMLAVENSQVTGFIHRYKPRIENTVACTSRWRVMPVASMPEPGMPGLGFPSWNVHLEKVRNGRPRSWQLEWIENKLRQRITTPVVAAPTVRKVG